MTEQVLEKKRKRLKRFMFDLNNFDDDHVEEEEFEEPPPPTFSEEDLSSAKTSSYDEGFRKGREEALQQSANSREQFVAAQLEVIAQNLPQIFEKENEREKLYETEAVHLSLHIFEKLFPELHANHGFDELKLAMTKILEKQSGQKSITVKVHPDAKEGIEQHVASLSARGIDLKLNVDADDALSPGACKMDWSDGGAIKNPQAMADEILTLMKDALAGQGTNGHDEEIEAGLEEPPSDSEPVSSETSSPPPEESDVTEPEIQDDQADTPEDEHDNEIMEKPDE